MIDVFEKDEYSIKLAESSPFHYRIFILFPGSIYVLKIIFTERTSIRNFSVRFLMFSIKNDLS